MVVFCVITWHVHILKPLYKVLPKTHKSSKFVGKVFMSHACTRQPIFNSLWPSGAIWHHGTWSTLVQVMAYCLMAPCHYLNQYWLIISEVCGIYLKDFGVFTVFGRKSTTLIYRGQDKMAVIWHTTYSIHFHVGKFSFFHPHFIEICCQSPN